MFKKNNGFTIVELLIVVVVIAILAAIIIVSYSGIQNRAKNAQFLAAFDTYEKVIRSVNINDGSYPDAHIGGAITQRCLGDAASYPQTGIFNAGECFKADINGSMVVLAEIDPLLNNRMLKEISTLPRASYDTNTIVSGNFTYYIRGILYTDSTYIPNVPAELMFVLSNPDTQCGRGQKLVDSSTSLTTCKVQFN